MASTALTRWLTDPSPSSRRQARLGQAWLAWLRLKRNPLAMFGLAIIVVLCLMAVAAPLFATHDPFMQNLGQRLLPPGTPGHWLGTDDFGRDIWSRIVHGARITLTIVAMDVVAMKFLQGSRLADELGAVPDVFLPVLLDQDQVRGDTLIRPAFLLVHGSQFPTDGFGPGQAGTAHLTRLDGAQGD